jgi:hypothetical protein
MFVIESLRGKMGKKVKHKIKHNTNSGGPIHIE